MTCSAKSVLIFLLMSISMSAFAQEKLVRRYTAKDGLASNTVYSVLVDKKGYLWFATDAGVSLYDGTSFTNFSAKDGLADNEVLSMFEDNDGRIWFVCYNQQPCFYYKGRFFNAANFRELQKIKNYYWHSELISKDEVWFSGNESIYRFKDSKITEFSIPGAKGLGVTMEMKSKIYVFKDSVFYVLNEKSEKLQLYPGLKLNAGNWGHIIEAGNENFVLVDLVNFRQTYLYLLTIDPEKHRVSRKLCSVYDKEISKSTINCDNNILSLTFTNNEVIEKNVLSDSLETIAEYKFNTFVSGIAIDPQGNKWFSLLHGGVEMFPKNQSNRVTVPLELRPSTFFSIALAKGRIVVGNNDNTLLFLDHGNPQETKHENFYAENNRVIDVKTDKHNRLWMGTDNGICIYDINGKRFSKINIPVNVKDIKYDAVNDAMLFASSGGAFIISCTDTSKILFINNDRATSIAGSLYDTCWYETLNGLYMYDGRNLFPDTSLSRLFQSRVTCLEIDKQKRLWVGTSADGVFVVRHNKIAGHFTVDDGLTSNICKNIFIDEHDDAWVSTNLGVSYIKNDSGRIKINKYNDKNCLVDNDVNDVLVVNDTVYAVSSTGIAYFNKNNISNSYLFPVYITGLKAEGTELVPEDSAIKISSKHNTLSISFTGLSYLSNGDIKYEYYIKELNDKPLFTRNNSVTFSDLSPGTYNFYVSATDVFGNKSISPAHVKFRIVPEWYQLIVLRWLAALSSVALLLFITFRVSHGHEKRKRIRSELNQTVSRLELEAIRLQINPHFIFNCLNAIQNAILNNNIDSAGYFINRFAKLMRKALLLSKENFISIDEEFNFINNYLEVEQLRHNNSFDYVIEIDSTLNKSLPFIPAFVLQPFIENSINHGIKYLKNERGVITLKFIKNGKLEIQLNDNGIGIDAAKIISQSSSNRHTSKGIELMLARIESLNKMYGRNIQIKITDKAGLSTGEHGTTVIISLDLL